MGKFKSFYVQLMCNLCVESCISGPQRGFNVMQERKMLPHYDLAERITCFFFSYGLRPTHLCVFSPHVRWRCFDPHNIKPLHHDFRLLEESEGVKRANEQLWLPLSELVFVSNVCNIFFYWMQWFWWLSMELVESGLWGTCPCVWEWEWEWVGQTRQARIHCCIANGVNLTSINQHTLCGILAFTRRLCNLKKESFCKHQYKTRLVGGSKWGFRLLFNWLSRLW